MGLTDTTTMQNYPPSIAQLDVGIQTQVLDLMNELRVKFDDLVKRHELSLDDSGDLLLTYLDGDRHGIKKKLAKIAV